MVEVALLAMVLGVVACTVVAIGHGRSNATATFFPLLSAAMGTLGAGVVAARARRGGPERFAWAAIAAAMMLPAVRNLLFPAFDEPSSWWPLWLCYYPLVVAGLLMLMSERARRWPAALAIDGAIAGCTVAALAAMTFGPFRAATNGTPLEVTLALAFPAGDLLLVAVAAGALSNRNWRAEARWTSLLLGFAFCAVADVVFMVVWANGTHARGGWPDVLRPAAMLLVAAAAWMPTGKVVAHQSATHRGNPAPQLVCTFVLVAMLVLGGHLHLSWAAESFAAMGLIAVAVRFGLAFRDVSRLAESHRHAMTDDLTLLGNRRAMAAALDGVPANGAALLLLDLNRFKEVNDSLGHHVGDQLLRQVSRRLAESMGPADFVARMGGDEFAILLRPGTDAVTAETIAMRITAALDEPSALDDAAIHVGASIGLARYPEHCANPADLVRCADAAMYRAKTLPGRFAAYDDTFDSRPDDERDFVGELRTALTTRGVTCHYQPKVSCRDGHVRSVEALIRWNHPTRGLLTPDRFLQHAEMANLMRPLALAAIDTALRHVRAWRDRGIVVDVAVNLSVTNLLDAGLIGAINDLLHQHHWLAESLILEITEGVLITDGERSASVVERLQALGVKISIDDFGTGGSSLRRLRDIAVDELKIDGVFVRRLVDDPRSQAIVESTVALAHGLGADVAAEGVEDERTVAMLRDFGCDVTQGFVHCPPLPADEAERWIRRHHERLPATNGTSAPSRREVATPQTPVSRPGSGSIAQ